MDYKSMSLIELCKLPGVVDIQPITSRASFAKALKAEAEGNHQEAQELLNTAISKVA